MFFNNICIIYFFLKSDYWPIRIATELDNEDAIEYFISSGAISKDEVELEKQKVHHEHCA